jgi:predicted AlkP superfamily phosphohydrolase/phosphomutase
MVGLDAADCGLVERWSGEGRLPNIARLRSEGAYGWLDPGDGVLFGPPWPSFYTGKPVSEHGLYEYLVWRPDRMVETRASGDFLPLHPFWRQIGHGGPRCVVVDVPLVPSPTPFNGAEVTCWGTHERLVAFETFPPELRAEIETTLGRPPMLDEAHHRVSLGRLLRERDALLEATRRVARLAETLLSRDRWDLGIVCFSATHRAGHKMWAATGTNGRGTPREAEEFPHLLRDVYEGIDEAIGRVERVAEPDARVLIFSLHGMGPNTSRALVLQDLLDRILHDGQSTRGSGILPRLRTLVPLSARDRVKRRLPVPVQDRLSTFWRTRRDWSTTRAISLAADLHGYVRLNVVGREARGSILPDEYEDVCARISDGLATFRDADTGAPVVARVVKRTELFPDGECAGQLPDLLVVWGDTPASDHRLIESERFGSVDWPTPGANPDGRSGNHRPRGWLSIRAPGFPAGGSLEPATILDLAPTALEMLGCPLPSELAGRPIPRLAGGPPTTEFGDDRSG